MSTGHCGAGLNTMRRVWAAISRTPQATIRELADELGMSYGHVSDTLAKLGYVEHPYGSARARTVDVRLHTSGWRIVTKAD